MSEFWRYFHEYLAWPAIFQPGAIAVLAKGLALHMDDVKTDIDWLRDQFVPPKAAETQIPGFGESRGIPRTRYDSDARYRMRTEKAFLWHKLGGRETGMPQILEDYGYPGGIVENMRYSVPARWAHFRLKLLEPPQNWGQADIDAVYDIANAYKPGRSVIDLISFALRQQALSIASGGSQRHAVEFLQTIKTGTSEFPPSSLDTAAIPVSYVIFERGVS